MTELKFGSGKITKLDKTIPYLEYEFTWTDKTTGEPKSATCHFLQFVGTAKDEIKITSMKVGDSIQVEFEQKGQDKVLHKFGPKQQKGGGWNGFKPKSPEERRSIELQSCLRTTADVFIACLNKSTAPVAMDFPTMMKTIREQAEVSANWIRDQSKGV